MRPHVRPKISNCAVSTRTTVVFTVKPINHCFFRVGIRGGDREGRVRGFVGHLPGITRINVHVNFI